MERIAILALISSVFIKQIRLIFSAIFMVYSIVMLNFSDFCYHKTIYFSYIVILTATLLSIKQKNHELYFPYMIALLSIDIGDVRCNIIFLILQSIIAIYNIIDKDGIMQSILICFASLFCFCNILDHVQLQSIVPVYILSISLLYVNNSSYTNKSKQVNTLLCLMYLVKFYNVCDIKPNNIEEKVLAYINICTMLSLAIDTLLTKNTNKVITNSFKLICHNIIMQFSLISFTNIMHIQYIFLSMMSMMLLSSINIANNGVLTAMSFVITMITFVFTSTYFISWYTILCNAIIILQLCMALRRASFLKIRVSDLKTLFIILLITCIYWGVVYNGFVRIVQNIGYILVLSSISVGIHIIDCRNILQKICRWAYTKCRSI